VIYTLCGIGIIVVIALMAFGFAELGRPLPPPKEGSYAEYLSDEERLSVQSTADWELAKQSARERGWKG
jgi:hypothetical protein